jgi:hypothetical protein
MTERDMEEELSRLIKDHNILSRSKIENFMTQKTIDNLTKVDLLSLINTYVNEAETRLLESYAEKADQEYSWGEVDNWIFAFGDIARNDLIKRRQTTLKSLTKDTNGGTRELHSRIATLKQSLTREEPRE